MKATPLKVENAAILETVPFKDERGAFEVFWEANGPSNDGISFAPWGAYHSHNLKRYTLRGMHFQEPPHGQARMVSCVRGSTWDVIVDLRPDSPSYLCWDAVELNEASGRAVYVPRGCAHGFLTLTEHSTVAYLIEGLYVPEAARALRWNDPAIGIEWPLPAQAQPLLSAKDRLAPDFRR